MANLRVGSPKVIFTRSSNFKIKCSASRRIVKLSVDEVWKIDLYHVCFKYVKLAWSKYLILSLSLDVLISSLFLYSTNY